MPATTSPTDSRLRRRSDKPSQRSTDLRDAVARAERARRARSRANAAGQIATSERSPIRHIATLVSARNYLEVSG